MRDRLEELQQRAQESTDVATDHNNPFSMEDDDDDSVVVGSLTPQAVVFEEEPVIDNFLSEAQQIRDDISELETEVRQSNTLHLLYLLSYYLHFHIISLIIQFQTKCDDCDINILEDISLCTTTSDI